MSDVVSSINRHSVLHMIRYFQLFSIHNTAKGLDHVAENILSYLDAKSLCAAESVCKEWYRVISEGMLWKKLIERMVRTDTLWRGLAERRGWWVPLRQIPPMKQYPVYVSFSLQNLWWFEHLISIFLVIFRGVYLFKGKAGDTPTDHKFYRNLYPQIIEDIEVRLDLP